MPTSTRPLDMPTLEGAARDYAAHFGRPTVRSRRDPAVATGGRDWAIQSLYNAFYKDEFAVLLELVRDELPGRQRDAFDAAARATFTPREDAVFEALLAETLAITPAGEHIEGRIGRVVRGERVVGKRAQILRTRKGDVPILRNLYWPVYAGETEERQRPGGGVADPIPDGAEPLSVGALGSVIAVDMAIAGLDAMLDLLDEGTGAAICRIVSGSKPADVSAALTGTVLATLVYSDPAFNGAADDTPNAVAAADTITADSSADDTGTATHYRASSSDDGAAAKNDRMDGTVGGSGTAGTDYNMVLNTTSIVAGATVSMTSHTVTLPEAA